VPDIVYACDRQWWQEYEAQWQGIAVCKMDLECRCGGERTAYSTSRRIAQHPELVDGHVSGGGNSGHEAVSLAYHMGASAIILLGFDMLPGHNGAQHWHGDHGGRLTNPGASLYRKWTRNLHLLAASIEARGVPVRNATKKTALKLRAYNENP
jgi:hypothetical protein